MSLVSLLIADIHRFMSSRLLARRNQDTCIRQENEKKKKKNEVNITKIGKKRKTGNKKAGNRSFASQSRSHQQSVSTVKSQSISHDFGQNANKHPQRRPSTPCHPYPHEKNATTYTQTFPLLTLFVRTQKQFFVLVYEVTVDELSFISSDFPPPPRKEDLRGGDLVSTSDLSLK